jgi:hypothetical protein
MLTSDLLAQKLATGFQMRALWLAQDKVNDLFATPIYPAETFKDLEIGLANMELQIGQSFRLTSKTKLSVGITYEALRFRYQNWNPAIPTAERPKSLHAFNLPIEWMQNMGDKWYLQVQSRLGLASDLTNNLQSEDILWQGFGLIGKTFGSKKNLRLGLGITYNTLLGTKKWLPAIDVYWQKGKIRLEGLFPFQGGAYWAVADKFELGLEGFVRGNRFNLHYPEDSPAQSVAFNNTAGGISLHWKPTPAIRLNLLGGLNINRTYEILNDSNKKIADFDTSKLQSPFVEIGLHWRWKKEKELQE